MSTLEDSAPPAATTVVTPYQLLGEDEFAIRRVVDRFYDLMETDPAYRLLRGMHATDLAPMRDRLAWWLTGWLGGPPRYQEHTGGGVCITAAHKPFPIDAEARDQWMSCMRQAMQELQTDVRLQQELVAALFKTADFMRNHPG